MPHSAILIFLVIVIGTTAIEVFAQDDPTDFSRSVTQLTSPASTENSDSSLPFSDSVFSAETSPEPSPYRGPLLSRSKLTGDWFGLRTGLTKHGITFDVSSTQFYQGVATGGAKQEFVYGGRNDAFLNMDGEKLGLWKGFSATLHGESRYGESANSLTGALSPVNQMLAVPQSSGSTTALTGVTFTQTVSENLQVYAGKINTLDSSDQPLTGANSLSGFQNTAMLYNPVYARTVPYSTFGAGFTCLRNQESVFSMTVYDTNDTPTVSGFDTFFNNGATVYAELNHPISLLDRPGHQSISGTYSTGTYTDLTPSAYLDPIQGLAISTTPKTGSWCLAYHFDQALGVSPADPKRMWGVFSNLGIADSNPSPVHWFASAGISGASQLPGRTADSFGLGYYYLGVSPSLKNLAPTLLPLRDEQGVELYYNASMTPWFQITPSLQAIDPFREGTATALLFGIRAKIDF